MYAPSAQPIGSIRYTWAELRERAKAEEERRAHLSPAPAAHSEREAEREGRRLFQGHLVIALALLLPALAQAHEPAAYLVLDPDLAERAGVLPACPQGVEERDCIAAGLTELLEAEEALLTLSDQPTEEDPAVWNAAVRYSTEEGDRWQRVLVIEDRCR